MTVLTGTTPVDELAAASEAGWPRAFMEREGLRLPLPWVNGLTPATDKGLKGWMSLDGYRTRRCESERLCFCCGLALVRLSIMGRHRASLDDVTPQVWLTDGPAGHPRCIALATAHCPHLREQHRDDPEYVIALAWDGIEQLGYVELPKDMPTEQPRLVVRPGSVPLTLGALRELASRDPLGERAL